MTKKFWKDWQKRFGETQDVLINQPSKISNHMYTVPLLGRCSRDKIVDAEWFTDSVVLKIERYTISSNINGWHYALMGVFPCLLLRTDINTVRFKKTK